MFDLTGKNALVTGASGGIGAEIARSLHARGATVGLSGTRTEPLEALAAARGRIRKDKHRLLTLPALAGPPDWAQVLRSSLAAGLAGLALSPVSL